METALPSEKQFASVGNLHTTCAARRRKVLSVDKVNTVFACCIEKHTRQACEHNDNSDVHAWVCTQRVNVLISTILHAHIQAALPLLLLLVYTSLSIEQCGGTAY